MDAITICAVNYLPFAHVLGSSFLDNNPDSTFSILVIDANEIDFNRLEQFRYFSPSDLALEEKVFRNMTLYYTVTELATALKPSALKMLLKRGSNQVIYLDPDIEVFDEFTELNELLNKYPIVLTPHTLTPIPRDGLRPTEADILSSGTFNLGFIGLANSPETMRMLDWWEQRLQFDSISDPEEMLFTDQRWIDLVPSYFTFTVLNDPGYNVAYWNLQERNLNHNENNFFADKSKLKFFHFSGYRPETPWLLSKYVANKPRVVISSNKTLQMLCESYSRKIFNAGWKSEGFVDYGYSKLSSGREIPISVRRLYREDCIAAFKNGKILEPPDDWQSWATSKSMESGNLSRILFSLWNSRSDLKRRFPDATGAESEYFIAWAANHGVSEKVIDEDLIEISDLQNGFSPKVIAKSKGINVAGYLQGEFGLGQSARLILQSAKATGLPVSVINSQRTISRQNETFDAEVADRIYPFVISVVNADQFEFWIQDIGREQLKESTVVGVWAWETEEFPKHMHKAFKLVDEIWAVSDFVKQSIKKHTNKPVLVIPTPVLAPKNVEKLNRTPISLGENDLYNLFIFDYLSVFNRKNPLGVIEAHIKAFPNEEGPKLIIKSSNGDSDAINRERLRFATRNRRDILLIEDYLSRPQLTALINECCTYISLHRSEGYGLTMAEAMSLGKPVIATGYSGNLDFMDESNSTLIPFQLIKVGEGSFPYHPDSHWADPNIEIAAQEISRLFNDEPLRVQLGSKAAKSIQTKFTIENAAQFIESRYRYQNKFSSIVMKKINRLQLFINNVKFVLKSTYRITVKTFKS